MTVLNALVMTGVVVAGLVVCALAFVVVCGTAPAAPTQAPPDAVIPPVEPEQDTVEDTVELDPPPVRLYTEPGWTMFRGGLVHTACLGPLLMDEVRPCAGCAVHLDHVLTGAS